MDIKNFEETHLLYIVCVKPGIYVSCYPERREQHAMELQDALFHLPQILKLKYTLNSLFIAISTLPQCLTHMKMAKIWTHRFLGR